MIGNPGDFLVNEEMVVVYKQWSGRNVPFVTPTTFHKIVEVASPLDFDLGFVLFLTQFDTTPAWHTRLRRLASAFAGNALRSVFRNDKKVVRVIHAFQDCVNVRDCFAQMEEADTDISTSFEESRVQDHNDKRDGALLLQKQHALRSARAATQVFLLTNDDPCRVEASKALNDAADWNADAISGTGDHKLQVTERDAMLGIVHAVYIQQPLG